MSRHVTVHLTTMLLAALLLVGNAHGQKPKIKHSANAAIIRTGSSTASATQIQIANASAQRTGRAIGQLFPVSQGGSCPEWTKCPIDGAQSMLVRTEYEGIVAIGVYEHTTSTGETHRFRLRCN